MASVPGDSSPEKATTVANSITDFVRVQNPAELEDELRSRLPISANVLNAVLLHRRWGDAIQYYSYGWENPKEAWIVVTYPRSDTDQEIVISRPMDMPISPEMKERLKRASFIDWNRSYLFCAIEEEVAKVLTEISIFDYGNRTIGIPNYLFYLDAEEAKKLKPAQQEGVKGEIVTMDPGPGTEFLQKTWKYANSKSRNYMEKCLKFYPSFGVAVDGQIVCGATFNTHGLIGMLHTLPEARGKGYAKACMQSFVKKLADEGFVPACAAEVRNKSSRAVQTAIGLKQGPKVYWIRFDNDFK